MEQNCPSNFKSGAKMSITVKFLTYSFTHHPLSHHHYIKENKYISLPHVLVGDESTEDDASKSQKYQLCWAFLPRFWNSMGNFASKKFYMGIFTDLWQQHRHFCTLALIWINFLLPTLICVHHNKEVLHHSLIGYGYLLQRSTVSFFNRIFVLIHIP